MDFSLFPGWFLPVVAELFGLCFGSFANVVGYRLPRGESISQPPSHCPACDHLLSPRDNIPLLGWFLLRGKCRYCGGKISFRYPLWEGVCGVLFAVGALYVGWSVLVVPLCLWAFGLLCMTLCDFADQTIPDSICIFLAIVGVAWVILGVFFPNERELTPRWQDALLGVVAGGAPLFIIDRLTMLIAKKDAFGYGDVKLMAATGIFLGWRLVLIALLLGVLVGGVAGVFVLTKNKKHSPVSTDANDETPNGTYMPFGPALGAGCVLSFFFGNEIIAFYANLLTSPIP